MREFVTAVDEANEPDEVDEGNYLTLDGQKLRYYRPTEGQYMVFAAETNRHANNQQTIAAVVNFFVELFDEEGQQHLIARLLDRNDRFGIETINEILDAMAEEWAGRPTQPSTGSSLSRSNGGRKSSPRTTKKTSSASRSVVSAT
jgi:hypothetical protein